MNAKTKAPVAKTGASLDRADAIELLRVELETEAATADPKFEPLYSWLTELADRGAGAHIPKRSPTGKQFVELLGVGRSVAEQSVRIGREWLERFRETLGEPEVFVFPDPELATARRGGAELRPVDDELVAHLAHELELAPADERIFYQWLLERARIGRAPFAVGGMVRIVSAAEAMGVKYHRAQAGADILRRWAPLFPDFDGASHRARRTRLPGCDAEGTDVPDAVLIEALRAELANSIDDEFAMIHRHLLQIAEGDRTVPRGLKGANMRAILHDAGIPNVDTRRAPQAELRRWVDFFHVGKTLSLVRADGTLQVRERVEETVARWLESHLDEDGNPLPIKASPKHPHGIAWLWVSRETGIPRTRVDQGVPRKLIQARWDAVEPHPIWEGIPHTERRMRKARRQQLLAYVDECVAHNIPLPSKDAKRKTLDFDELVRRSQRPGPNLSDDKLFIAEVRARKPKYEYVRDNGGVPASYAQMIDGITRKRLKNNKTTGSKAVTRSKIDGAISIFYRYLGKGATSPIDDDFTGKRFEEVLDEIVAANLCGTQPENWRGELLGAQRWLAQRVSEEVEGDDFHDVLKSAVRRDGRTVKELIKDLKLSEGQVKSWLDRSSRPTRDAMPDLRTLATRLNLAEDRLIELVGSRPHAGFRDLGNYKPPNLVAEFMPDDWRSRQADEQRAIGEWINDNLVHRNNLHGQTMREVARRTKEDRERQAVASADGSNMPPDTDGKDSAPVDHIGPYIDRQLTVTHTGLPKRLIEELKMLRRHMTVDFPSDYLRRAGVSWAAGSTAPMKLAMLIRFFKWQIRPEDEDGLGRDAADLTLADLIHPPLIFAYIDYKARALEHVEIKGRKRGKVFTTSEADLLRTVKSLVSREFGLVTQQTDLAKRIVADERPLPDGSFIALDGHIYNEKENDDAESGKKVPSVETDPRPIMPSGKCGLDPEAYVAACRRAELEYGSAERLVDERAEMIRDPAEAIMPILDSPQPMTTLLRQVARAARLEPKLSEHPLQHHLHVRDMLIVRLLALTSLRSKNLREITVGPNGKLRFDESKGSWLLKIHWREFKNYRSAVLFGRRRKRQPYAKWLQNTHGLHDLINYYIEHSRPYFIRKARQGAAARRKAFKEPAELFLSQNGRPLDEGGMWKVVFRWTARHVAWNPFRENGVVLCQPFGPHAFRDIRATDILLNPETDNPFLEAAMALQTSPTMIQNHYGIMRTDKRTALDDISFVKRENLAWAGIGMD